jgi:hypothetical protein
MLIYPYGIIGVIAIKTDAILIDLLPPFTTNSVRLGSWTKDNRKRFKATYKSGIYDTPGKPCTVTLDVDEGSETVKVVLDEDNQETWFTVGPEALYAIREKVEEITHVPAENKC